MIAIIYINTQKTGEEYLLRDYIGGRISIDGRMIEYRLITASDYFIAKEYSEEEIEEFDESGVKTLVNQIMALKQSCFLMRRVSYSCGSLSEDLYDLKLRLIFELREKYAFEFDDDFVENYGFEKPLVKESLAREFQFEKLLKLNNLETGEEY